VNRPSGAYTGILGRSFEEEEEEEEAQSSLAAVTDMVVSCSGISG
jgi:hypothetical protein